MKTEMLTWENMDQIVALVKQGEVVAFPTDTVFGLGVDSSNEEAINKLKYAKHRDAGKPFPFMIGKYGDLEKYAYGTRKYRKLIRKFMPGALTIIVRKKPVLPDYAVNGNETVAIRMPDDPMCLKLLRKAGGMSVTSANMSGEPAANNESEVLEQLDGRIAAVVKGNAKSGVPSTILDLTGKEPKILREGEIKWEDLKEYL